MDEKILDKIMRIAEKFFDTATDPTQMPISKESLDKLQRLHPDTFAYKLENGEPVSWIVVLPTTKKLAEEFLSGKINERELLDMTEPQEKYEALYLCSAFTVPGSRRKGYAEELIKKSLASMPLIPGALFFAWPFSEEGRVMIEKMEKELDVQIRLKE